MVHEWRDWLLGASPCSERAHWRGGGYMSWVSSWKTWWQRVNVQASRWYWPGFISYHEPFSENSWNQDTWLGSSWNDELGMGCNTAGFQVCFLGLKPFPEAKMMKASLVKHENKHTLQRVLRWIFSSFLFLSPPTVGQSLNLSFEGKSDALIIFLLKVDYIYFNLLNLFYLKHFIRFCCNYS